MRVLFVDDDDVTLFLYRVLAESTPNCVPFYAKDGKEALEMMEQEEGAFDFMFLDINMPIMDGFELLRLHDQLPENKQAKKLFVMLGTDISPDKRQKLNVYNISSFIPKPLRRDIFSNVTMQISE